VISRAWPPAQALFCWLRPPTSARGFLGTFDKIRRKRSPARARTGLCEIDRGGKRGNGRSRDPASGRRTRIQTDSCRARRRAISDLPNGARARR
jgi:hypothetical protein